MAAELAIPLRVSSLNAREHWAARARRVKRERGIVRLCWYSTDGAGVRALASSRPLRVTLVRVGRRAADMDNVVGGCKGPRDEIASLIGVDDKDGTDGVTWHYEQRVGSAYGLLVKLETEQ